MDLQTVIAIATLIGLLVGGTGIAGAYRLSRTLVGQSRDLLEGIGAVKALADAQLTENGGGSLVDKVNKTWADLPKLQETVENNHAEARDRWSSLDRLETDVKELKAGREVLVADMAVIRADVAEFRRGQEFFRRFAPLLMALEPEDRRVKIQALAERVQAEMEANGGTQ